MSGDVEMLGAIDPEQAVDPATVRALLVAPPLVLDHDGEFTGRPVTTIRATDRHVLKERDRATPTPTATAVRDAVEAVLARERSHGVHPPEKTWFLVHGDPVRVCNVTRRRTPLHLPEAAADPVAFVGHLRAMLRMYLRVAARFRVRLDEGLSNFAVDGNGRLAYVDDDVYPWDDFAHFSHSVGVVLRRADALTGAAARALGHEVRRSIVTGFGGPAPARRVADAVRGLYFNGAAQAERRDGFLEGLLDQGTRRERGAVRGEGPIALLADVHANLPALEAVLEDMRVHAVERALVLGDVVGYGPHPRECVAILRDAGFDVVRGNHDHATATGVRPAGFNAAAFRVVEWTREQLDADDLAWLGDLPTRLEHDGWRAQHGAPMDPAFFAAYVYRLTYEDNLQYLRDHGLHLAFHGHTHVPSVYHATGATTGLVDAPHVALGDHDHALVCPGSVGRPRSGGTAAQWASLDPATLQLRFHAVAYDLDRTAADMVAHGLPSTLVERLRAGR